MPSSKLLDANQEFQDLLACSLVREARVRVSDKPQTQFQEFSFRDFVGSRVFQGFRV